MRIHISHATTYHYETPPIGVTQMLRLTPRNHDGQYVVGWRIELSEDCLLHQHEDAFGNITHSFTAEGPVSELAVAVDGEVETQDTHGVVNGAVERFPPALFLRETALTQADAAIADFAEATRAGAGQGVDTLALLHFLLNEINREITFDTSPTQVATTAAEAFALRRGVCQDLTHIFIAAARQLGIPARYIGGHFYRADGITAPAAGRDRVTVEQVGHHDILLRNSGARRTGDDRRHAHQCGPRQRLHLPQAARLYRARRADRGARLLRQSVVEPDGAQHAHRGRRKSRNRRTRNLDERADNV